MCGAQHLGVAQLVARYLGVVEAASSSLVTQTNEHLKLGKKCSISGVFLHTSHSWLSTSKNIRHRF